MQLFVVLICVRVAYCGSATNTNVVQCTGSRIQIYLFSEVNFECKKN